MTAGATPYLLPLKLVAVAAVVLGASLVARRFGHAAGGLLAGMPMIAGPIAGLLLIDLPSAPVRAVCLATLACQPALLVYLVAFAHAARRFRAGTCLALALVAFVGCGTALLHVGLPEWARVLLALCAPPLALRVMPRGAATAAGTAVGFPRIELACRVVVAVVIAAGVMWGAQHLGPGPAGLLLAAPIAGIVLPLFTQARHGSVATAALLAGFVRGQFGFAAFFAAMLVALPLLPAAAAWFCSMLVALAVAWVAQRHRLR